MLTLTEIPLTVTNRALELYGEPPCATVAAARAALDSIAARADGPRLEVGGGLEPPRPITPFAAAVAEYLSLSGPWAEDGGAHAGEDGYVVR